MRTILALAFTFALHSELAFAQMQKFIVADFRLWNHKDEPVTMNSGTVLEVLGLALGMSGPTGVGQANALKKDGYSVRIDSTSLECRGQTVIGVSTPYPHHAFMRKQSNELDDQVSLFISSPYSNQTYQVKREVRYRDPEAAPSITSMVEALEKKYGEPNKSEKGYGSQFPSTMIWNFRGATLSMTFNYYQHKPGIIEYTSTDLRKTIRGEPVNLVAEDQQKICNETRHLDQAQIKQLNERNPQGPRL